MMPEIFSYDEYDAEIENSISMRKIGENRYKDLKCEIELGNTQLVIFPTTPGPVVINYFDLAKIMRKMIAKGYFPEFNTKIEANVRNNTVDISLLDMSGEGKKICIDQFVLDITKENSNYLESVLSSLVGELVYTKTANWIREHKDEILAQIKELKR